MGEVVDRETIRRKLVEMAAFWRQRIDSWREDRVESGTEKRHAQQFWSDLMKCFDISAERLDIFERNAVRASTSNRGYIDFFWSGVVIGEAKSLNSPLGEAYDQVLDYLNGGSVGSHEWPRFIILTNFENFRLERLGAPEESWSVEFAIDDLPDHLEQLLFFAGAESLTKREQENASIEAAKLMANLFNILAGEDSDQSVGDDAPTSQYEEDDTTEFASILMTRLLFLMYGDDAGLWEEDLFYRWVETVNSKNIGPALDALFDILNTDTETRLRKFRHQLPDLEARFPYVNGGVFDGTNRIGYGVPPEFKEALLDACRFRWTSISPAIFGSMFQLVKSREARRGDGEHYTSEKNILKTLEPLFLGEYRERADRLISNKSTSVADLQRFQEELASNIYVAPACGAGNFLNVAYARLREIETDIIVEKRQRSGELTGSLDATLDQLLTIDKFYGIEINWWPAKIAETAMFLVDHQANRILAAKIGEAPNRLPITTTAKIIHANALRVEWGEVFPKPDGKTFIFGNPPFIGHQTKSKDQREDLKDVWEPHPSGRLDYVTGWHAKSMKLLASRPGEFAFVTTNSISQGQSVPDLFRPLFDAGWGIKFAHRTFKWDSEAPGQAAVHCVIIGFTQDDAHPQQLWDYDRYDSEAHRSPIHKGINPYLVDGPNVLVERRAHILSPELERASFGTMPIDGGNLIVEEHEYAAVVADPVAKKYLRPFRGSRELVNNQERWCLWMAGDDFEPADIQRSKILRDRISACHDFRNQSGAGGDAYRYRDTPHLMRPNKNRPHEGFVCVPRVVSEHRRYMTAQHYDADVIASDSTFTILDPTMLQFGLISSSMFMTWQRTIGGRLKSDIRFANTLTWNNFPVPLLSAAQREMIINAAEEVLEARELYPNRSLADQYNPLAMDPRLVQAHNKLDSAVDKALGASRRLTSDKQRLELLFENYELLNQAKL